MFNTLRTKPLMCISLAFLCASCVAVYIPTLPKMILTGLFLLFTVVFAVFGRMIFRKIRDGKKIAILLAAVCLSIFAALSVSLYIFDYHAASFSEKVECEDTVTLEITGNVYVSSFGARYYAKVTSSKLFSKDFKIILDSEDPSLLPRDRLSGKIMYRAFEENSGGFNEERYALSKGIVIAADEVSLTYTDKNTSLSLSYLFSEMNERLCRLLYRHTGEEDGGLASALLLGNQDRLPDSLKRDFRRLGIIHILCLSGAHLAILTTFSEGILLKLRIGKKKRAVINIALVLLFMALTGFSPSLTRAGIMVILANIAYFAKSSSDYSTSLTFSCALIVAVNPFSALDYGLHLSFSAAHSCYISSKIGYYFTSKISLKKTPRNRKARRFINRIIRYITSTTVYNIIISINVLPLLFLYYGEISLVSLPANLLYLPLITVLMYITVLFYLLSPFVVFSGPLSRLIVSLTALISSTSEEISSLRGIVLPLNYWFTSVFVIPIVILTAVAFSGRKKVIRFSCLSGICIFAIFLSAVGIYSVYDRNHVTVEYITEGKNDGFLVKSRGHLLVVDVSDASYSFASRLASLRCDLNCAEIEGYMLTHYHKKHIASLSKLTEKAIVRTLILPMPFSETDAEVYNALVALAREKNIGIVLTDQLEGDTVMFNRAAIETYSLSYLPRSEHPIVAVRFSHVEEEIMYLGGSFNEGDEEITNHAKKADTLIFGGHSPVYKKVFDPQIAESKTVYLSEYAGESLRKLSPDITGELQQESTLTVGTPIRLD